MASKNSAKTKSGKPPLGRRTKTLEQSRARVARLFSGVNASGRQRMELMSIVCDLFCRGGTRQEIQKQVLESFPASYAKMLEGENFWDLLREAAVQKLFLHTPHNDFELTHMLLNDYSWLDEHLVVVQTASTDAVAQQAAKKLLDMIRNVRRQRQCDTVHVGFAGGMTLRSVAARLAQLLSQPHPDNPKTLVFHAMVASFDDDDFYADPNSFITYFITPECCVDVRLVRLPLPGIIESARYAEMRTLFGIERVFERRNEIQIVVTSGSLWTDERSTLRTYMKAAINESQRRSGSKQVDETLPDKVIGAFDRLGVLGDLLWQPISSKGRVRIDSEYQVTTLMDLDELPGFISRGGSVLLVMGCSGVSRLPKSQLLKAILDLHRDNNWVTDVVTDSPTVEGIYYPDMRSTLSRQSRIPKPR